MVAGRLADRLRVESDRRSRAVEHRRRQRRTRAADGRHGRCWPSGDVPATVGARRNHDRLRLGEVGRGRDLALACGRSARYPARPAGCADRGVRLVARQPHHCHDQQLLRRLRHLHRGRRQRRDAAPDAGSALRGVSVLHPGWGAHPLRALERGVDGARRDPHRRRRGERLRHPAGYEFLRLPLRAQLRDTTDVPGWRRPSCFARIAVAGSTSGRRRSTAASRVRSRPPTPTRATRPGPRTAGGSPTSRTTTARWICAWSMLTAVVRRWSWRPTRACAVARPGRPTVTSSPISTAPQPRRPTCGAWRSTAAPGAS